MCTGGSPLAGRPLLRAAAAAGEVRRCPAAAGLPPSQRRRCHCRCRCRLGLLHTRQASAASAPRGAAPGPPLPWPHQPPAVQAAGVGLGSEAHRVRRVGGQGGTRYHARRGLNSIGVGVLQHACGAPGISCATVPSGQPSWPSQHMLRQVGISHPDREQAFMQHCR